MSPVDDTTADAPSGLALPPSTHRLFAHYPVDSLGLGDATEFLVGRLLEDGETGDLQWLTTAVSEECLVDWLRRRAARQLSRRSRAFWEIVLGCQAEEPLFDSRELWPL